MDIKHGPKRRVDIFFEKQIGIGIHWDNYDFPLTLCFDFPFFTITIGIGKARTW